ncbi:pyridoxamine 5'-phosphate oxidase [Jejudonia soesokkakensis]|uniref:Pyridoxine/pyridoxamine 5'-phosphate oxidase n=1 Tax=Jejudonia soesokkakensis TaxID=1323432 RepID=A0ABW2MR28_9FLAO
MNTNLHNYRKSYEKGELTIESVAKSPFDQFENWFSEAEKSNTVDEINAMTLSTVDAEGFPRGRVVLLKEYDDEGYIFYTNYKSEKGQSIAFNPNVCISFFWPALEQQIIIKGIASKVSEEKAVNYFRQRPRKSQLGALVSNQSEEIKDRATLEERLLALEQKYEGEAIPKPENWGGYKIFPVEFEFWQGRRSRLHDRIVYRKNGEDWNVRRVQP